MSWRRNAIVYNSWEFNEPGSQLSTMLSFLRLLKQRYECIIRNLPKDEEFSLSELRGILQTLTLAEAFLEKGELNQGKPDHPTQIAIIGPTQAGKSSVLNWLTGSNLAEVSPLAGFTVHPQGFAIGVEPSKLDWTENYFRHYHRKGASELDHEHYDSFLLESVMATPENPALKNSVIWDTPDFDSIDAEDYKNAVLRIIGLADIVILIVSKDKYADFSVWYLMQLISPLSQSTLICLNKVDPESSDSLKNSLENKWRTTRSDPPAAIVAIPYLNENKRLVGLDKQKREIQAELGKCRHAITRSKHNKHAKAFLDTHWDTWLKPVYAEHQLQLEWRELVDKTIQESVQLYKDNYLNHPRHYSTFQRALAELLTLLELPGIGHALVTARKIVTWPIRQLQKIGNTNTRPDSSTDRIESTILKQASEHAFIHISESLLLRRDDNPTEQTWWRELSAIYRNDKSSLLDQFDRETATYQSLFQPEIDRTAQGLLEYLKKNPAVLNSLRATRATTEAAALAIALHTGGLGIQDLILAPAMLSLTSMLTESALGRYMKKAEKELKQKQMATVEKLFRESLQTPLLRLPAKMDGARRFDISPETLRAAESQRF